MRAVFTDRSTGGLVLCAGAAALGWGLVNLAGAPLAAALQVGARGYGGLETALGLGGLVGASLAGRSVHAAGERAAIGVGVSLGAIGLAVAAASPGYAGVIASLALGSAARAVGDVAVQHALQASIADSLRGRVLGLAEAVSHIAFALAFAAGGPMIDATGPRFALAVAAGAALLGLAPLVRR